jgi:hypothetical protein
MMDIYSGAKMNVKRTYRRVSCLLARLLGNMHTAGETKTPQHISAPMVETDKRWLHSVYLDTPEE